MVFIVFAVALENVIEPATIPVAPANSNSQRKAPVMATLSCEPPSTERSAPLRPLVMVSIFADVVKRV
jgi:hypothetical protein